MDLIKLYKNMLEFAGLSIIDDEIYIGEKDNPDKRIKILIDKKPLVLPTNKNLKDPEGKIMFHILIEKAYMPESPVLIEYSNFIKFKFNTIFYSICGQLLDLGFNSSKHSELSPIVTDILIKIGVVDKKCIQTFQSILKQYIKNKDNLSSYFITIRQKKGSYIKKQKYGRVSHVIFPFYKELQKDELSVLGIKIRESDKQIYMNLCKYIFPIIEEEDGYSKGSNAQLSPWLDSLMKTSMDLALCFNEVLDELKEHIFNYDELYMNLEGLAELENIDSLCMEAQKIPPQDEGRVVGNKQPEIINQSIQQPTQQNIPISQQRPLNNNLNIQENKPSNNSNAITPLDFLASINHPMLKNMPSNNRPNINVGPDGRIIHQPNFNPMFGQNPNNGYIQQHPNMYGQLQPNVYGQQQNELIRL